MIENGFSQNCRGIDKLIVKVMVNRLFTNIHNHFCRPINAVIEVCGVRIILYGRT